MDKTDQTRIVSISTPFIRLDALLKLAGAVPTGGIAKLRIQNGEVLVGGVCCTMRGKKLRDGEIVELDGLKIKVQSACM